MHLAAKIFVVLVSVAAAWLIGKVQGHARGREEGRIEGERQGRAAATAEHERRNDVLMRSKQGVKDASRSRR